MSIYRTSMMLCSSVFALSLMLTSEGFCDGKQETVSAVKAPELKEKDSTKPAEDAKLREDAKPSEKKTVDSKKEVKAKGTTKVDIAAPLSDAEEDADEKQKREQIEKAQKKSQYAAKIELVRAKYSALLGAISGESKEIVAQKLRANSEKVRVILVESLKDPKSDVFEKLEKGIKRKNAFIQSKKESVGTEDAAWFEEVYVAAQKQLKRLEKLKAEFEKNKDNAAKHEETRLIYVDKIGNFIASYDAFTACTYYLGTAKAFCNDKTISNRNMKVQFPDFSAKAFKEFAVPDDLLNGERAPLARVNGYSFYAIDKKEYKKGEFSKAIPSDSEDGKLISAAKSLPTEDSKKILDPDNGGIILSSRMILKPGMSRPLCVFSAYALNGETETVSRFSVVHGTEENMKAERQLTAQLIKAENQPAYDALAVADEKLKKALAEEIKSAGGKPTKKAAKDNKKGKESAAAESKGVEESKKVAQEKPDSKDAEKAKSKSKDDDAKGTQANVKPKAKDAASDAPAEGKSKSEKRADDAKGTEANVKPEAKDAAAEVPAEGKPKSEKKADDAKGAEANVKPKAKDVAADAPTESKPKSKKKADDAKRAEADDKDKKPAKKEKAAPALETVTKEEANSGGFFSKLFGGSSKEDKPQNPSN